MLVLLAATERGLASYWRTPAIFRTARGREAAGVPDGERVLALLHFGSPDREPAPRERAPVETYVRVPGLNRIAGRSIGRMAIDTHTRESVPFRVRTADGDTVELTYSSPRPAATHDERSVLDTLPWFEPGKPLRNHMLHETDFYDEVEQIWGRRWGAEGIGTLREVLVSRPTENETRPEYAQEWQYYYSSAAGNADLGRLQAQFDAYYQVLEDNGVRVNYIEPPVPAIGAYGWIKNLVTLAGGGLVVHGGAILHRYGLGSWQRGREVIWEKTLAALQVPIYLDDPRTGHLRAGSGTLARREDLRLQRIGRRERGGPPPARVRAVEPRRSSSWCATAPAGTTRPATATSAPRTWTWSC